MKQLDPYDKYDVQFKAWDHTNNSFKHKYAAFFYTKAV